MQGATDGANEPETQVVAHTFDIRFGRAAGLASLFDAPANSLGWKGSGLLSIDGHGISIALKRGLVSWLAGHRSQRISAENIREVYREGEALRVEFATGDSPRVTLPFWAHDRDTAARIVALLPTTRTVEIEKAADESHAVKSARRTPVLMAAAVMILGTGGVLIFKMQKPDVSALPVEAATTVEAAPAVGALPLASSQPAEIGATGTELANSPNAMESPTAEAYPARAAADAVPKTVPLSDRFTTPDEARKLAMLAEDPVDWTSPPPSSPGASLEAAARRARVEPDAEGFVPMEIPEINVPIVVVPIKQTTLAYSTARSLLSAFEAAADDLAARYRREQEEFEIRSLDARTFAGRLDALEIQWRSLSDGMLQERKYDDPQLTGLRATLLSVVVYQRAFLTGYAAGLRDGNQERIDRAFKDLERSNDALVRARQYVN